MQLQPTAERESLCGSAWKRKALLESLAGEPEPELAAIRQMRAHYAKAGRIAHAELEAAPQTRAQPQP